MALKLGSARRAPTGMGYSRGGVAGRVGASGSGAPEKPGEGWDGASFGGRWARGLIRGAGRGFPRRSQEDCLGTGGGEGFP